MLNRYYRRIKRNRLLWLFVSAAVVLVLCALLLFTDVLAPFGMVSPMENPRASFLEWICERTNNKESVYVKIEDKSIYHTGLQWGNKQTKRDVCIMRVEGDWIILLPAQSVTVVRTDGFSGYFSAKYGQDSVDELVAQVIETQYGLTENTVATVILEEVDFTSVQILIVVYLCVLLLLLSLFFLCLVQMIDPRHSRTLQRLSLYGDVDSCIRSIESELKRAEEPYPIMTDHWIFARGGFAMLELVPFRDVVWYHKSRMANVEGNDGFGLVLYCYGRKRPIICWSTAKKEIKQIKRLQERLETEAPWIDPAYRREKARLWRSDSKAFISRYGRR